MDFRERDIYTQLARFYCPEVDISDLKLGLSQPSTDSLTLNISSEQSLLTTQLQSCLNTGYQFTNQAPTQVGTDLVFKRTREFTMTEPMVALEQAGSDRFLVGTASCSVVGFDTKLRKISVFQQLHSNRISALHSFCAGGSDSPTHFLSGSDDHLIKLNSHERNMTMQTFVGSDTGITSLSYDPSNDIFISANRSGHVHMWSQKAQRPLCLYSCENAKSTFPVTLAQFTLNPGYFVAASGTFLSLWDLRYNARPVTSTNLLPSYAERLVLLSITGYGTHHKACDWAVLTSKGLFRVTLDDNPRIVQGMAELSLETVCDIVSCNLFTKKSEPLKSSPCLLTINREGLHKSIGTDEDIHPLSILDQCDYRKRLDYVCKRPHQVGRNAHGTYLRPSVLEPENQGFMLVSSNSTTLHLYHIGTRGGKGCRKQSKNEELNDQ